MTIHLPGLPVTADCAMAETEERDEGDGWSDTAVSSFYGFTSEEIEEQKRSVQLQRYTRQILVMSLKTYKIILQTSNEFNILNIFISFLRFKTKWWSYDSSDDLTTPFDNEQLLQHDEEYEISKKLEYKLISGEEKGKLKYKKISESKSDTSVFTSSKSPLKMVFKKTSSTITVSPSVTPEPMPSIATKNLRKESVSNEPEKPVEAFASPSQVSKSSIIIRKISDY